MVSDGVAFGRVFYLDDISAKVSQDGGRHRARKEGRQVEHSHAG
jgi:hypothetical protein